MAYVPFNPIPPQFQGSDSVNLSGGTLEFYIAGTTTATNVFSDDSGTVVGTTVTLNASGYPASGGAVVNLFRDTDVDYKIVLKDASDVTIWTSDDIDQPIASDFAITDSAGNFAAANVEDALAEAKGTYKIATADAAKSSDTTLADDATLAGWSLVAGAFYVFELLIPYTFNVGDLQVGIQWSNTPNPRRGIYIATDSSGVVATGLWQPDTAVSITTLTDSDESVFFARFSFQANATTGGTMDVQWAQNTSSANNTTVREGRYGLLTRVSS